MEPVSHTTTKVVTDKRVFKTTAPDGDVYYTTLTIQLHKTNVSTAIVSRDAGELPHRLLRTTIRTTLRQQLHRVAPYPGARPVRLSSFSNSTAVVREGIVLQNEE